MFEVNRAGEIVWSFVNHTGEVDGKPLGGVVGGSFRFPPGSLTFIDDPSATAGTEPAVAKPLPRG